MDKERKKNIYENMPRYKVSPRHMCCIFCRKILVVILFGRFYKSRHCPLSHLSKQFEYNLLDPFIHFVILC